MTLRSGRRWQRRGEHLEQVDRGRVGDRSPRPAPRRSAARSWRRPAPAGRSSHACSSCGSGPRPIRRRRSRRRAPSPPCGSGPERIAVEIDDALRQLEALARSGASGSSRSSAAIISGVNFPMRVLRRKLAGRQEGAGPDRWRPAPEVDTPRGQELCYKVTGHAFSRRMHALCLGRTRIPRRDDK